MQDQSRFVIGIDLGTTNSCIAYLDTDPIDNPRLQIRMLPIPQLTAIGQVEPQLLLPSFYYLMGSGEFSEGSCRLPWTKDRKLNYFVGKFAREHGAKVPTRLVQSAKSWLSNAAADRREKILPIEFSDPSSKVSPVEATAAYLSHLAYAWNSQMVKGKPENELQEQEILLTVPASFDEVARMLTIEAAKRAGYHKLTLLEEPQAAFYSWIYQNENQWKQFLQEGDCVLVCDVGGGTTDFSLIEVQGSAGELTFQRKAVGNHLLLGGDNMDQALCHFLEAKLKNQESKALESNQWLQLAALARSAKETLLGESPPDQFSMCIQGSGSRVISGSINLELSRKEIEKLLSEGFFGSYTFEEATHVKRSSGLQTMGLPYEAEPSITKHLAVFLKHALKNHASRSPNFILFNGGSMKPAIFRESIIANIGRWFNQPPPKELPSMSLDLAVSRGAAYFGRARRGMGLRIGGGIPRSYYLVIEVQQGDLIKKSALTLLPRGAMEGEKVESNRTFMLTPNLPVAFHLLSSHTRLDDKCGDLVEINQEEMFTLPPIQTVLRYGKKRDAETAEAKELIPVKLSIELSEIGTLELWLHSVQTTHQWRLEFQLRNAAGQENSMFALEKARMDETFEEKELLSAKELIAQVYSGKSFLEPNQLVAEIEKLIQMPKAEWPPSVLRSLFETVLAQAPRRNYSTLHESRWWNLIGFLLRPGYGYPLDDFRVKELWKVILGDLKRLKTLECQLQSWICYRRIAGGLNKGQQTQILSELLADILSMLQEKHLKGKVDANEYAEKIRLFAAMELVDTQTKIKIGEALLKKILSGKALQCDHWALGRIGARQLLRGTMTNVIPKEICGRWIETLISPIKDASVDDRLFLVEQLARKTEFREINIAEETIEKCFTFFKLHPKYPRLYKLLTEPTPLTSQEQDKIYGEHLPVGLTLLKDHE